MCLLYEKDNDHTTTWWLLFTEIRFSFRYGYLYSFLAVILPLYKASMLGGDFITNGVEMSIPWLTCWITCVLAGLTAMSLSTAGVIKRTTIIKMYAGFVLVASPLMLLGVLIAKCDQSKAKFFMYLSVVLFGFERSSIRINSLDLCSSKRYQDTIL